MNRKTKRSSPFRILVLLVLVGAAIYFNEKIVPSIPSPFVPTPVPTRSPESYVLEAQTFESQGKYASAIQSYTSAIGVDPRNPSNYIALARVLIYTSKYEEAITNAENALLISENNAQAYAYRGWAMGLSGDFLNATASLDKAIQADPNNAAAYAYLAEVLILQKQAGQDTLTTLDSAIEASRKAETLAKDSMEAHRARGLVLEETGNTEEAITEFQAAIAANPNIADLHIFLGRSYRAVGDSPKAVEEFNLAVPLDPTNPLPKLYISRTYAQIGEFVRAVQYGQQALNDDPTDPFLYGNLGAMLYKNKQYDEAVQMLKMAVQGGTTEDGKVVEGLPLDYGRVAEFYYTYGLALAKVGTCGDALQISQALQKAVRNDEVAVFNAQEIVNICQQISDSGPDLTPTATLEGGETETPTEIPTETATPVP